MIKRNGVKLTDKAHMLVKKKAEEQGISMKQAASEAVLASSISGSIEKEYRRQLNRLVFQMERTVRISYALAAIAFCMGFGIGMFVAGCSV